MGAPFVGKTTLALELARYYGLHYIHVTPVLYEAYIRLVSCAKAAIILFTNRIYNSTITDKRGIRDFGPKYNFSI